MAIINCPECNKLVSDTANSCPHCGYLLKKTYKGGGFLIFTIVITLIAASIFFFIKSNPVTLGSTNYENLHNDSYLYNNLTAYNFAKDFVKERLKSPSTAKFPGSLEKDRHSVSMGSGMFMINSWVDSQNALGATIRNKFSCIIIFEDGKVRCEQLKFE